MIQTPSLNLRPFELTDAGKVFQMSREEGIRTWLPDQVYRDEGHAAAVLASLIAQYRAPDPRLGPYVLGVELRGGGPLIGHVGLSPLGEVVEVGFAVEEAHRGKGFAVEAVRGLCHWAAEVPALETIFAFAAADNAPSQGVLRRAGFAWERDEVMAFQGRQQQVRVFTIGRR